MSIKKDNCTWKALQKWKKYADKTCWFCLIWGLLQDIINIIIWVVLCMNGSNELLIDSMKLLLIKESLFHMVMRLLNICIMLRSYSLLIAVKYFNCASTSTVCFLRLGIIMLIVFFEYCWRAGYCWCTVFVVIFIVMLLLWLVTFVFLFFMSPSPLFLPYLQPLLWLCFLHRLTRKNNYPNGKNFAGLKWLIFLQIGKVLCDGIYWLDMNCVSYDH